MRIGSECVFLTPLFGDDDDGGPGSTLILTKTFDQLESVHQRHADVGENEIRYALGLDGFQCIEAVCGYRDPIALRLEVETVDLSHRLVVVDAEDLPAGHWPPSSLHVAVRLAAMAATR